VLAGSRALHLSAVGFATAGATLLQAAPFKDIEDEDEFEDEDD
jgi:hypothetical protein